MKEEKIEKVIGDQAYQEIDPVFINAMIDFIDTGKTFEQFIPEVEKLMNNAYELQHAYERDYNLSKHKFVLNDWYGWEPPSPVREEQINSYPTDGFRVTTKKERDVERIDLISNASMGLKEIRPVCLIYYALLGPKKEQLSRDDVLRLMDKIESSLIGVGVNEQQVKKRVDGVRNIIPKEGWEIGKCTVPKLDESNSWIQKLSDKYQRESEARQIYSRNAKELKFLAKSLSSNKVQKMKEIVRWVDIEMERLAVPAYLKKNCMRTLNDIVSSVEHQ